MGVLLVCVDCGGKTWTDLVEFDDVPIADWWASKGERCVRCRRRGARPGRRRPVLVAPADAVLPNVGTKRRAVYDLLLTAGERGASFADLGRALGRSTDVVARWVEELVQDGLVKAAGVDAWRVTSIERVSG